MFNVELQNADQVKAGLSAKAVKLQQTLANKINLWLLKLQAKIVSNLAGGVGLQSRKGTAGLAGSVRITQEAKPGAMSAELQAAGGTTWYGRMWELSGHKDIFPTTKKALAFQMNGKNVIVARVKGQGPRPWFGPPVREMVPQLQADVSAALKELGNE